MSFCLFQRQISLHQWVFESQCNLGSLLRMRKHSNLATTCNSWVILERSFLLCILFMPLSFTLVWFGEELEMRVISGRWIQMISMASWYREKAYNRLLKRTGESHFHMSCLMVRFSKVLYFSLYDSHSFGKWMERALTGISCSRGK